MRIVVVCLFIYACFTGCTPYGQSRVSPEPSSATQVTALLKFFDWAKSLQPHELEKLYIEEEEVFFQQDNTESMLRLALLLTIPRTKFRNPDRAARLLARYMASNSWNAELRHFSSLLLCMTVDLQQYEAMYKEAKEKLDVINVERKSQQRKYYLVKNQLKEVQSEKQVQQAYTKRVGTELRKERQAVEDLRKKIEQLKTIEKTINERRKEQQPAT